MKPSGAASMVGGLLAAGLFLANIAGWGADTMQSAEALTKVMKNGQRLEDTRLTVIKDHKTPWEFEKPVSLTAWKKKREYIRRKVLISCGLWPRPEPPQSKPEVFERKEHEDYTVEKVLLPTFPGYYATGNLYRPKQDSENKREFPAVLCPHGHWEKGRFEDSERASVPARAINFARQGYVCLTYDMVGYGDNKVLIDHNFGGNREALWGITPAGFQLYTSMVAFDFIRDLEDVDPNKIACTGASGGGTQTFLLYSVEDRIRAAAPVNMISAHMQGGCKCENPPGLRLDLNNMEIGAMFAPRPLIMVCATGDWTKNTPQLEFPAIHSVYELYKRPDFVTYHLVDADHNYNKESREAVYAWFKKCFYRDRPAEEFLEKPYVVDPTPDLQVFSRHPIPSDVLKPEELFASLREAREKQVWDYLERFKATAVSILGQAYCEVLAVEEPSAGDISRSAPNKTKSGKQTLERFLLKNEKTGQCVPANLWMPPRLDSKREFGGILLIHPSGKSGWVDAGGKPSEELRSNLEKGTPVLAIDCLGTGEFVQDASWTARAKAQEATGTPHFATYNLTDTQGRVQDVLLAAAYLKKTYGKPCKMVGSQGAGAWVLLAHGLAESTAATEADLSGLNFEDDHAFVRELYIPNLRRAGDFVTSILLGGERSLSITGCEDEAMKARLERARKK